MVVVDLLLHCPVGVVYLLYSLLVSEQKAVDTRYLGHRLDRRVESVHTDTTAILYSVHVVE